MLPAVRRLTRERDWRQAARFGRRVFSPAIVVKVYPRPGAVSRFGFAVGVNVHKRATERNLIKRRLRAAVAAHLGAIAGGVDVCFWASRPLLRLSYQEVDQLVVAILRKARLYGHHT